MQIILSAALQDTDLTLQYLMANKLLEDVLVQLIDQASCSPSQLKASYEHKLYALALTEILFKRNVALPPETPLESLLKSIVLALTR